MARLYTAGLGREPEQGGFDFWMVEYTNGRHSLRTMAQFFVDSPEFNATYGPLSNRAFVQQLYRNVLGREGEAGGVDFWTSRLDDGATRATILMNFSESPENITNSGTTTPDLGPFNVGRSGPWRCAGWQPGQAPPAAGPTCAVVGRNSLGTTEVRLTVTNPTARRATATLRIEGTVDGVRRDDQFTIVRHVAAGETVDEDTVLLDDVFDSPPLGSIGCGVLTIEWDAETDSAIEPGGCRLVELNVLGSWDIEIGATNPLGARADATVLILPYLDGRRVDAQFSSIPGVAPGTLARRQSILLSDRVDGVDAGRVRCDLLVLEWEAI